MHMAVTLTRYWASPWRQLMHLHCTLPIGLAFGNAHAVLASYTQPLGFAVANAHAIELAHLSLGCPSA